MNDEWLIVFFNFKSAKMSQLVTYRYTLVLMLNKDLCLLNCYGLKLVHIPFILFCRIACRIYQYPCW